MLPGPLEDSMNHKLPSGPTTIPDRLTFWEIPDVNFVMTPAVVIRPIAGGNPPTNHMFPSGPVVIAPRLANCPFTENSLTVPVGDLDMVGGGATTVTTFCAPEMVVATAP